MLLKAITTRVTHYTTGLGVTPPYKKTKALPLFYEIHFLLVFEWDSDNPKLSPNTSSQVALLPLSDLVGTTNTQIQMKWNQNAPSDTLSAGQWLAGGKSPLPERWRLWSYLHVHCLSDSLELTASPPTCVKFYMATMKGKKSTNRESEITKTQNRKIR